MIAAAPRTTSAIQRAAKRIAANSLMNERTGAAYTPRGSALELMGSTVSEVLLSGPAGTGKSRAALQKIHFAMEQYPGARALILRKTRASLTETGLQTFEDHVLGPDHPLRHGPQRQYRQHYSYKNSSEIIVGGLDNWIRIMSGEYDIAFLQEGTEAEEEELESVLTRLRNGKMPFQQLIIDANPSYPRHWLKQRADRGQTLLIPCSHKDNPVLWDEEKGEWTERGRKYLETLDGLSGATRRRLRDGEWVQATGVIFDMFNEDIHVNARFDYNPDLGSVYWACDDGYAEGRGIGTESYHPRVILLCQINQFGGINIFKEYHRTGVAKYTETIEDVRGYGYPDPEVAYVDAAAAQFRGELTLCDIPTCTARHRVEEGIRNLQKMFKDENGVALIGIHPRCRQLIRELQSYRRTDDGLRILKADDHGIDPLRYFAWTLRYGA